MAQHVRDAGGTSSNGAQAINGATAKAHDVAVVEEPAEAVRSTKFVTVHGYRRAYRIAGSGPALLLIHGIGDSSSSWVPLMPRLAERFTVVAPDLLGHGNSDKPRADYSVAGFANGMRDLLEILGIRKATIVGHALGGGVAAQFAYQYPQQCERLVLVSTGGIGRSVTPVLRLAAAPMAEMLMLMPMLQFPLVRLWGRLGLEALRWSGHDLGRDAGDLLRVLDALPDSEGRLAFTRTLRAAVDWRGQVVTMLDRQYLTGSMPVQLMWGTHDGIIPVHHAHHAHAAIPSSRLEIFEGAGHFPHHADPDRFIRVLLDFVDTTAPSRHEPERWRRRLRRGIEPG
jgi:pimeloyl-ACP methyl ester carboxylesterase